MIKSMTGYAKVVENFDPCMIKVEIKTLNSKYMDSKIKLPKLFNHLEIKIINLLKDKLDRGKIDLNVDIIYNKTPKIPRINNELLAEIIKMLHSIRSVHNIEDSIKLEHLLHFNDVLNFYEDDELEEEISKYILSSVEQAINKLDEMRSFEGEMLKKDILQKLDTLNYIIYTIEEKKDHILEDLFEKIKNKIELLLKDEPDKNRVYQEAAMYAERGDIEEEVTRIKSHILHFKKIIENEYPIGKKLDFMCQELYREFNTIGSKSSSTEIINMVVEGKNIVDKLREQVQNIV
ncbi:MULTISPECIES: YicC/YloC family endoribonuclease [Calditerrivibrio]|uniref:YicC family protein n=1 Tax=Calditerrivibrio nitroreducens TaxID=477976 RepID=A0A2J6WIN4_9BACT|nr:MAG: YicC family protein [Calditerrivibrio nitroreducens]